MDQPFIVQYKIPYFVILSVLNLFSVYAILHVIYYKRYRNLCKCGLKYKCICKCKMYEKYVRDRDLELCTVFICTFLMLNIYFAILYFDHVKLQFYAKSHININNITHDKYYVASIGDCSCIEFNGSLINSNDCKYILHDVILNETQHIMCNNYYDCCGKNSDNICDKWVINQMCYVNVNQLDNITVSFSYIYKNIIINSSIVVHSESEIYKNESVIYFPLWDPTNYVMSIDMTLINKLLFATVLFLLTVSCFSTYIFVIKLNTLIKSRISCEYYFGKHKTKCLYYGQQESIELLIY